MLSYYFPCINPFCCHVLAILFHFNSFYSTATNSSHSIPFHSIESLLHFNPFKISAIYFNPFNSSAFDFLSWHYVLICPVPVISILFHSNALVLKLFFFHFHIFHLILLPEMLLYISVHCSL